jgi:hypothetical protein
VGPKTGLHSWKTQKYFFLPGFEPRIVKPITCRVYQVTCTGCTKGPVPDVPSDLYRMYQVTSTGSTQGVLPRRESEIMYVYVHGFRSLLPRSLSCRMVANWSRQFWVWSTRNIRHVFSGDLLLLQFCISFYRCLFSNSYRCFVSNYVSFYRCFMLN